MLAPRERTRWLIALVISGAVACSFGVDLDGLVGGPNSTPTNDGGNIPDVLTDVTSTPEAAAPSTAEIVSIGAGQNFTCALKKDGTVNCWGRGTEGRLGSGTTTSSSDPVVVVNINTATELTVGLNHACALLQNGTVECWGQNDSKQLGNTTTTNASSPTPVVGLPPGVKHISGGGTFTCAQLADDTAMCWGDNSQGNLGVGSITAQPGPVAVKGVSAIKQLVTTNASACALEGDGSVWCWGDNGNGEIGTGTSGPDVSTPTQIAAASLPGVTALGVGSAAAHMCAVLGDTTVKCWGYGQTGSLGSASNSDSPNPVPAATVTGAVSIMLGANFTCALHKDATVNCWGANGNSTLPLGDVNPPASASTPLPSTGLAGVTALTGGTSHACAQKDAHTVLCWGIDQYGALGRKRTLVAPTAVPVASTTDVTAFSVGREFGCAAHDGGALACWGNNSIRQQARTDYAMNGVPKAVPNVVNAAAVAAGDTHACVVNADAGTVQCWGEGDQGNLGNFSTSSQSTPVTFQAGASTDVGAGSNVSCALTKSNEVYCAGYDVDGRLGRSAGSSSSSPAPVVFPAVGDAGPSPLFANSISVGRTGGCAVYNGKTRVVCWGSNSDGQLGASGSSRNYPADVTLPHAPVMVRMGYRHTCAILVSTVAEVYCWGRNVNGQLTGTDGASNVAPRQVDLGGHGAKDVALGDDHTCAVLDDGTVMCWGAGTLGQLGNGGFTDSAVPVVATGVTGATAIRANENHTCAMTATGLMCWGTDYAGQLGVSALMETGTPDVVQGL